MTFFETYGPATISGGAILISAFAASCFAYRNISTNRELNRKQATLRLIQDSEEKEYYRSIQKAFFDFFPEDNPPDDATVAALVNAKKGDPLYDKQPDVDSYLNHYELIAVGIENQILDEGFYNRWMRYSYVLVWERAMRYIILSQAENPRSFIALQVLAIRWGGKPPPAKPIVSSAPWAPS